MRGPLDLFRFVSLRVSHCRRVRLTTDLRYSTFVHSDGVHCNIDKKNKSTFEEKNRFFCSFVCVRLDQQRYRLRLETCRDRVRQRPG